MSYPDRIDHDLIRLLQNNGRLSNKELAQHVDLAPSTSLERVRRLYDTGAIRGVHADIDPKILGIGLQALCFIELAKHKRDVVENFRREILQRPEIIATYLMAGRYDFLVHVMVRDTSHLQDLALDAFTSRPEVTRIETSLIFNYERAFVLPDYCQEEI